MLYKPAEHKTVACKIPGSRQPFAFKTYCRRTILAIFQQKFLYLIF